MSPRKLVINLLSYLLYFKLTLARPVDTELTKPKVNKDKGANFEEGDAGRIEKKFKIAINAQLTA